MANTTQLTSGAYKPKQLSVPPIPSRINSIPGVSSAGAATRGAFYRQPEVAAVADVSRQEVTPLQTFQNKLKEQIQKNELNNKYVAKARKSGFSSQYDISKFGRPTKPLSVGNSAGLHQGVSGNAAWGGFRNGQIAPSALSRISFAPGATLRSDAAQKLEQMNNAFRRQFGRNIIVTDSYRSLQSQITLARQKPGLAARPGTSVHGLGLALDLGGGINKAGTPENVWFNKFGPQFGWVNPGWAKSSNRFEPWHFEFVG